MKALIVTLLIATALPAWAIDRDGYWRAQLRDAYGSGNQQRIKVLEFIRRAGTLRYSPDYQLSLAGKTFHQPCCGEADAYEADDFEVDDKGNLWAILTCNDPEDCQDVPGKPKRAPGSKFMVPAWRVLVNENPVNDTGHGWIWIAPNSFDENDNPVVYCFSFGELN